MFPKRLKANNINRPDKVETKEDSEREGKYSSLVFFCRDRDSRELSPSAKFLSSLHTHLISMYDAFMFNRLGLNFYSLREHYNRRRGNQRGTDRQQQFGHMVLRVEK